MPKCANKGCGKEYEDDTNSEESCVYHSGGPVFHEGLKSWSCCNTVNKPVLTFDEFMALPGCTTGKHSAVEQQAAPSPAVAPPPIAAPEATVANDTNAPAPIAPAAPAQKMAPMKSAPAVLAEEEEEDMNAPVPAGTTCRHNGCTVQYETDEEHRIGDGPGTVCTYHPGLPIFHEGSKGYFCCKRRVLEFDEFLKIEGCKTGRHVFVPRKTSKDEEELITCRMDHYQTPHSVQVSVYAKKTDKDRSVVRFEETQLVLDLFLPESKRFSKTIDLFGPIDPEASSFKFLGTKVDITLKKKDGRSWTLLEKTDRDLGGVALTFGVGGRTGTIGAKAPVLDGDNTRTGGN
ncbi:chord-domain-containing protein [Peniophora sp. CONT]|nr:chord-domain-containing protein [Peniophora sp. CONT]